MKGVRSENVNFDFSLAATGTDSEVVEKFCFCLQKLQDEVIIITWRIWGIVDEYIEISFEEQGNEPLDG